MAEGTFCEYPGQMDNALMSQIPGFSGRGSGAELGKYCLHTPRFRPLPSEMLPFCS